MASLSVSSSNLNINELTSFSEAETSDPTNSIGHKKHKNNLSK
ncbi:3899_t:CDS:1, partial [Racocetra fulgida]